MNSVDMANRLIFRARNLHEFTVITAVPDGLTFHGIVPFDMKIEDGEIKAKVWAVDFDEAVHRFDEFLESCR